jgi:hypothetical protein
VPQNDGTPIVSRTRVEERGFGAREPLFWYTTAKIKTNTYEELSSEALSSAGVVEAM